LKLYDNPLRRQLYSKLARESSDKDGRIDYDIAGRLVGNWFLEGLSVTESSRGSPAIWAKQLAFACDVHEPNARCVSIGGTVAPAGLYRLSADSPDPAEVNVKSGLVKLILTDPMPRDANSSHGSRHPLWEFSWCRCLHRAESRWSSPARRKRRRRPSLSLRGSMNDRPHLLPLGRRRAERHLSARVGQPQVEDEEVDGRLRTPARAMEVIYAAPTATNSICVAGQVHYDETHGTVGLGLG
jgi:hypothetical protein